jgi:hypothetical protein
MRLEGVRVEIMREFKVQLVKEKEVWEMWEADKV